MKKIIFLFLLTLFCLCGLSSNQNVVHASDKLIITFDFNYESIDKALYNTLQNKQSIVQKEYLFNEQIEFPNVDPDLNDFYQYYWTLNGQKVMILIFIYIFIFFLEETFLKKKQNL